MPTPTKGPRLGGGPSHERLLLANLATALFEHDSITTTEAKAKRLRPLAERLVTFAKRGDLHARRQVMTVIRDKDVVHKLFAEVAPLFKDRPGGYTRIVKIGTRPGDAAEMAYLELVDEEYVAKEREARTPEPVAEAEPVAEEPQAESEEPEADSTEEVSDTEVSDTSEAPAAEESADDEPAA